MYDLSCRPWFRYSTTDATLHGPWVLADTAFATVDGQAFGDISTPGFYALPSPRAGEPTHIINTGNQGGLYRLGRAFPVFMARETSLCCGVKCKSLPGGWVTPKLIKQRPTLPHVRPEMSPQLAGRRSLTSPKKGWPTFRARRMKFRIRGRSLASRNGTAAS